MPLSAPPQLLHCCHSPMLELHHQPGTHWLADLSEGDAIQPIQVELQGDDLACRGGSRWLVSRRVRPTSRGGGSRAQSTGNSEPATASSTRMRRR